MSSIDVGESGDLEAEFIADRADVFRAAHALVAGLEFGEGVSVYDVLQVAKYLAGDGIG